MIIEGIEGQPLPHSDEVYVRVLLSKIVVIDDSTFTISPSAFINTPKDGPDLSCDWSNYVNPLQSWNNIAKNIRRDGTPSNPDKFIIVSFNVGRLHEIKGIEDVYYEPMNFGNSEVKNIAHSAVVKDSIDTFTLDSLSNSAKIELITDDRKVVLLAKIYLIKGKLHSWKDSTKEKTVKKRELAEKELQELKEEIDLI